MFLLQNRGYLLCRMNRNFAFLTFCKRCYIIMCRIETRIACFEIISDFIGLCTRFSEGLSAFDSISDNIGEILICDFFAASAAERRLYGEKVCTQFFDSGITVSDDVPCFNRLQHWRRRYHRQCIASAGQFSHAYLYKSRDNRPNRGVYRRRR